MIGRVIGGFFLTLLYSALVMVLTMPIAAAPLHAVAKPLVELVVAGAVLAWLEKPWQQDYDYGREFKRRMRPVFMFVLLATALIYTIGWSSWQFIFWLRA